MKMFYTQLTRMFYTQLIRMLGRMKEKITPLCVARFTQPDDWRLADAQLLVFIVIIMRKTGL